jgi:hypothetical protein
MRAHHDDKLSALESLSEQDVTPQAAEQIRARALVAFREYSPPKGVVGRPSTALSMALVRGGWWTRVVEPLALLATVVTYLTWAALALASVHGAAANLPAAGQDVGSVAH